MPTLSLVQRIARQLRGAAKFLIPKVQRHRRQRSTKLPVSGTTVTQRQRQLTTNLLPAALLTFLGAGNLFAQTVFVDSRFGDDKLDGATPERVPERNGPVRTLTRAVQLVRPGGSIVLANTGEPYAGGFSLYGLQQSGSLGAPLEIIGNGCIITGAQPIDPTAWESTSPTVWRITPLRKGWYQLVLDGAAVPEVACPADATTLPELTENSWCAFQGRIYYRPPADQEPLQMSLALADDQTGISLIAVEHIIIRDVTIRHFRQDGVHLFDRCRDITLENMTCEENGRAGLVIGGTSQAELLNVTCRANRQESLLVEDFGLADATDSTFDAEPTVRALAP
ncbi:MAG: right-handed parallel beta-helix repeat-containing protein [Planctomycetaceae bacterium]